MLIILDIYEPPFKITTETTILLKEIEELLCSKDFKAIKNNIKSNKEINLIRSIHATCAIEENQLSYEDVKNIFDDVKVEGNEKEILEIINTKSAYEMVDKLNSFDEKNLLSMHKVLMNGLDQRNGKYRLRAEGVFDGDRYVFMAPPSSQVPSLMSDLFERIYRAKNEMTPLIYSNIFHYEFVFIHPFNDGNGRTARLRNKLLLSQLDEIFLFLPIEEEIKLRQQEYYKSISTSHIEGESTAFLNFMLEIILSSLIKNL